VNRSQADPLSIEHVAAAYEFAKRSGERIATFGLGHDAPFEYEYRSAEYEYEEIRARTSFRPPSKVQEAHHKRTRAGR
jgi:hypothetical protein